MTAKKNEVVEAFKELQRKNESLEYRVESSKRESDMLLEAKQAAVSRFSALSEVIKAEAEKCGMYGRDDSPEETIARIIKLFYEQGGTLKRLLLENENLTNLLTVSILQEQPPRVVQGTDWAKGNDYTAILNRHGRPT